MEIGGRGSFPRNTLGTATINIVLDHLGDFEIVSLTGTINTMDGAFYTHLHMSAGNEKGEVFGGHLNRAVISATCEMVITVIDGRVDRFHSEEIGLNLFQF